MNRNAATGFWILSFFEDLACAREKSGGVRRSLHFYTIIIVLVKLLQALCAPPPLIFSFFLCSLTPFSL